jgi:YD repeat-containing protein
MFHQPRAAMTDYDGDGERNDMLISVGYDLQHREDGFTQADVAFATVVYRDITFHSPPAFAYSYAECIWEETLRTKTWNGAQVASVVPLSGKNERLYTLASNWIDPSHDNCGKLWALRSHRLFPYDVDGEPNRVMECSPAGTVLRTTVTVPAFEKYPEMKALGMLGYDFAQETHRGQVSPTNVRAAQVTRWTKVQGGGSATYMPRVGYAWRAQCNANGIPVDGNGNPTTMTPFDIAEGAANHEWVPGQEITHYSSKGRPLETKGPTGTYSTTVYDRNEIFALATVANARYGECLFTSFEEQDAGTFVERVGDGTEATIVTSSHHAGQKCLRLTKTNGDDPYYLTQDTPHNGQLGAQGSKAICWEFWAKADQECMSHTHLQTLDNNSTWHGDTEFELGTEWRKYRFEATIPDGMTKRYHIVLRPKRSAAGTGYGKGYIYYDDVRSYPRDALMISAVYHPLHKQQTWACDANNNCTESRYDGFGRVTAQFNTAGKKVSEYEYQTMCEDGEDELKITYPKDGDVVSLGTPFDVTWEVACPRNSRVTLEWRRGDQGPWALLEDFDGNKAEDLDIGACAFKWWPAISTVGLGGGCKIRFTVESPPPPGSEGLGDAIYSVETEGTFGFGPPASTQHDGLLPGDIP